MVEYLKGHDKKLFPYVIGMDWIESSKSKGHVIVALDGEYIDLTLDQFDGYDDWIEAEPIESGAQIAAFMQNVRSKGGNITTRKLTYEFIPDEAWKLYAWLKQQRLPTERFFPH